MNKLIRRAFTLIELLVVIAIIGILSGLIIVTMNGVTQKASIAKSQIFSNSLRNALMMNMVGEWKFDNVSGTVGTTLADGTSIPDSWLTNNGTSTGGPTLKDGTDCVSGKCLSFDGNNDYVDLGSLGTIGPQFTLTSWFKTISDGVYNMILNVDGNINGNPQLRTSGGYVQFRFYNANQLTSSSLYNDGKWHFVVGGVNSSGSYFLYIDGVSQGTLPPNQTLNWSGNMRVGLYTYSGGTFYLGQIDDVRIFNAAMPISQIKEQYYAGLNSLLANGSIDNEEYKERINSIAQR